MSALVFQPGHQVTALSTKELINLAQSPSHKKSLVTLVHLEAPELTDVTQRKKPLCISAVLDVSGSMQGEKLNLAKETLLFMIDELSDRDRFGLISFESNVQEELPLVALDTVGKAKAKAAVQKLVTRGCTNLSGGLFAGLDQVCRLPFAHQGRRSGDFRQMPPQY